MRARGLFFLLVMVGVLPVSAEANYNLALEATLFPVGGETGFPPAYDGPLGGPREEVSITNRLGWALPSGDISEFEAGGGTYGATALAAETPATSGFPLEGPHGNASVDGFADGSSMDSWSLAEASVYGMEIRFSNRSDQDLWIDWELRVDWSVVLDIDDADEYASAGFLVRVAGAGVGATVERSWVADHSETNFESILLSFRIPKGMVSTVTMSMDTFGYAESPYEEPPPPPPPERPEDPPEYPEYPPPPPDTPVVPIPAGAPMVLIGIGIIWMQRRSTRS